MAAKGHVLGDIEPKIQIVDRSLLVSHVNVEGEQIDRGQSAPAEDLEESRKSVPVQIGHRRGRRRVRVCMLHLAGCVEARAVEEGSDVAPSRKLPATGSRRYKLLVRAELSPIAYLVESVLT